jgi:hypothetical protein
MRGNTNENVCWMHSSLLTSVDVTEFETTQAYSNLDLITYSTSDINNPEKKI